MKRTIILLGIVLVSLSAIAQDPATGFPPFGSFQNGNFDAVNRQNLNFNFVIPIVNSPGRGLNLQFGLVYDSSVWKEPTVVWSPVTESYWGWKKTSPIGEIAYTKYDSFCMIFDPDTMEWTQVNQTLWVNYNYTDGAGTVHRFDIVITTAPECVVPVSTGYANDGSGFYMDATDADNPVVLTPSGVKIIYDSAATPPGTYEMKDPNGNSITKIIFSSTVTEFKDTVGRTTLKIEEVSATQTKYHVLDKSGGYQVYTLDYSPKSIKTNFACSGVTEYTSSSSVDLPTLLTLPASLGSLTYSFDYEETPSHAGFYTGRLAKVTLPTGGSYEYQYPATPNNGINCDNATTLKLTRIITVGATSNTWTYVRSLASSDWETLITAPALSYDSGVKNESVFTFNTDKQLLSQKFYQGSKASGTHLRTISTTWASNGTPDGTLTTIENVSPKLQSQVKPTYDSFGNLTQLEEYAWGSGGPGGVVRTTQMTYLATSDYTDRNIVNRVTSVVVRDGGPTATKISHTDVAYDGTTLSEILGAAQHDDTNYGTSLTFRGNLTSIKRYKLPALPGVPITRTFDYDTLGNLKRADLDCCNQRVWAYSVGTQYAYPDSVTSGPSGGPNLTQSFAYNASTGLLTSQTDENSKTTTFVYDNLGRLTTVTRPDSVQITTSYDDAARTITTDTPIQGFDKQRQKTFFDQLGRNYMNCAQTGSGSNISCAAVTFTKLGGAYKTTNPFTSVTPPACTASNCTERRLDALGRLTHIIPPGGSASSNRTHFTYSGNTVTVTDPTGKQRRSYTDALGRLIQVDEPGGSVSPGTGSVTISGTLQSIEDERCIILGGEPQCFTITIYDSGSVSITVDGFMKSVTYGSGSTSSTIASALADAFNNDSGSPVSASAGSNVVNLTSKVTGASSNYSLSAGSSNNDPVRFPSPSFTASPSGPALTGGSDGELLLSTPAVTFYTYDPRDLLKKVTQGVQTRDFIYDAFGRLTSQTTPEAGTVSFLYNDYGLVTKRTDARGVIKDFLYDGLNRLIGVKYDTSADPDVTTMPNNCTPDGASVNYNVCFKYGVTPASFDNGRLIEVQFNGATNKETFTYDELGRVLTSTKKIDSTNYGITYAYNQASQLKSITYPSGRVVTQSYDAIGRLTTVADSSLTFASGLNYNTAQQVTGFTYGNSVAAAFTYSADRLQMNNLKYTKGATELLDLAYCYTPVSSGVCSGAGGNNGQITQIEDNTGTDEAGRTVEYTYDALGRLSTAVTDGTTGYPQWGLSWVYDRYGNRKEQNATAGSPPAPTLPIDTATNRIDKAVDPAYDYDDSGNTTKDGSGYTYTYDGEGRITEQGGTATAAYTYNGALRVKKEVPAVSPTTTTRYIYSGAKVIAEYENGAAVGSPTTEYIYLGSALLATIDVKPAPTSDVVTYHHADHLSVRVNTDSAGVVPAGGEQGHYPFGEEWYKGAGETKIQFTSYERDTESGLDYAMFRFDNSRIGRFMTPDPLSGSISNPQSLNRYGYVVNDPINLIDPLGLNHECDQYESEHVVTTHSDNEGGTHEHDDGYRLTCTSRRVHEEERDKKKKSIDIECDPRNGPCNKDGNDDTDAATECRENGNIFSFTIPFTNVQVALSASVTAGGATYNTANDVGAVVPIVPTPPIGAGVSLDLSIGQPGVDSEFGPPALLFAGAGRNLSVGSFLTPIDPGNGQPRELRLRGFNVSGGLSVGPPVGVAVPLANACTLATGTSSN